MEEKIDKRTISAAKIGIVGAKKKDEKDKVVPVQVYVKKSRVDDIGGIDEARKISLNALMKAPKAKK